MTQYYLKNTYFPLYSILLIGLLITQSGCDSIFGTKGDDTTDEIFEEGRIDPQLIPDDVGYAALLPFWEDFVGPTDIFIGYDELVYVTDEAGLHLLDRAGRHYETINLDGAVAVTQDRDLNVYVAARHDTIIADIDDERVWNLPAIYKFRDINKQDPVLIDKVVHPFDDASRPTSSAQHARMEEQLRREEADEPDFHFNDEFVELTDVTTIYDNTLYVTRKGPRNQTGLAFAPDNTMLLFDAVEDGKMRNTSQVRALNPNSPSLISAIGPTAITSFAAPPQRENITTDLSFMIAQGGTSVSVPFRVLWINAEITPDGLEYSPRAELLARDTTRADRFLYDEHRFTEPSGLAYSADGRSHIFVTDAARDSLYLFQSNGVEGVNPPAGSEATRPISVSFGGTGSGPREFRNPSGVAYFDRIVYVADTGNNRIARYRLNTDFE